MSDIGPGDVVECVDVGRGRILGTRGWMPDDGLVIGAIYQVGDCWVCPILKDAVISLVGFERKQASKVYGQRVGFDVRRFRPIRDGQQRIDRKALRKTHELVG